MNAKATAERLADLGFHVFPVEPGGKHPWLKDFPNLARMDSSGFWRDDLNVGISTSAYGICDEALLVVDIDVKKEGENGLNTIFQWELEGKLLPRTFCQRTPSGGLHWVYRCKTPVRQSAKKLGPGIDIRSKGGFIVGSGSQIDGRAYRDNAHEIVEAPEWLIREAGADVHRDTHPAPTDINETRAKERAHHYLEHEAPIAVQGAGGDATTFQVAARVKDFGVDKTTALELMGNGWNSKCAPPWAPEELQRKIENAYAYGKERPGVAAPEADFEAIPTPPAALHPIDELNKEFAFVVNGGGHHILWETTNEKGEAHTEHLPEPTFHKMLAAKTIMIGDGKQISLTKLWMNSPLRRSYDGICFMPGKTCNPRFYNTWRGFAYEPLPENEKPSAIAQKAVEDFLFHAKENICGGDTALYEWLMGYFAHIVQKPWEKPLVALVFKGSKGVGKNAFIDRIGHLLGSSYLMASDSRYLTGNFNSHFENSLLFGLDEAFWSGDKQAEGRLKSLITESHTIIERKGKEPYKIQNCSRIVILGNEKWLVPASVDERRFAVFTVGDGNKQDRAFFQNMREGMEAGGYRLLLRFLCNHRISDVNAAPKTEGLHEQKLETLEPFEQFLLECLTEGTLARSEFGDVEWRTEITKEALRNAFKKYLRDRQISSRVPDERIIGKLFKRCIPSVDATQKKKEGKSYVRIYQLPPLEQARKEWDSFIGHDGKWT